MVDVTCIAAAVFFTVGNILMIISVVQEHLHQNFSKETFRSLNPAYIEQSYDAKYSVRGFFLAAGFSNALAWILFTIPMMKLAWVLSHGGKSSLFLHSSIAVLMLGGSLSEVVSQFFWYGTYLAHRFLGECNIDKWLRPDLWFDLDVSSGTLNDSGDGIGWRVLELTSITTTGFIWVVDSFEYVCLGISLIFVYISVQHWRAKDTTCFGRVWNNIGLLIGLMSLILFVGEVVLFEGVRVVGLGVFVFAVILKIFFIPCWIFALGFGLDRAAIHQNMAGEVGDLALTPMRNGANANPTSTENGDGDNQSAVPSSTETSAFT